MRLLAVRRRAAVALITALVASSIGAAGPASAEPAPPGECPAIKPLADVAIGDIGDGWTVERGTARERFRFEVLGVVADGIAPGRDLIIVEVSDAPGNDMLSRAGGIWAGMSGSPVYLGNELLGAIAYGFSAGPSNIGGVTPAEDMMQVLGYGAGAAASAATSGTVTVPSSMRANLAERAGVASAQVSSFKTLPVPFAVSGLNARARNRLQEELDRRGLSGIVVPASRAARSAGTTVSERPQPGGNFAGVVSYGALTLAGIGTTTYVCGNQALAFGHPLTFVGRSAYGANDANAIAVVDDPTFGPFKLATVGGLFGKLDQDRLAAVRATLTATPALRAVRSTVRSVDTGRVGSARTDVTMNEWVPDIAAFHLLLNSDSVFDQIGKGSSRVKWTVNGTRRNGAAWQLVYSNRYASRFDITGESISQLFGQLATIEGNRFEAVRFTSVDIEATLDDTYREYAIEGVRISKNGGRFRERALLTVEPGDELIVRVLLRKFRGSLVSVDLPLTVPPAAQPGSSGVLAVRGAPDREECCPDPVRSFSELLNELANAPKNAAVTTDLLLFGFDGEAAQVSVTRTLDRVVTGRFEIEVVVP